MSTTSDPCDRFERNRARGAMAALKAMLPSTGFFRRWRGITPTHPDARFDALSETNGDIDQAFKGSSTSSPLPPSALRKRVHGAVEPTSFEQVGGVVAGNLRDAIASVGSLGVGGSVLDFGCGCGRVLRHLSRLLPEATFVGSDIDPEAIHWCRQNLPEIASFVTNDHEPPLPFADGTFDCVYAISVFTHLPEPMQFSWLKELCRVTRPEGYLLLSTHGERHIRPGRLRRLRQRGFYYESGSGTPGLPKFYQTAFYTEEYLRNRWGKIFDILRVEKQGINNDQDLVICRTRSA